MIAPAASVETLLGVKQSSGGSRLGLAYSIQNGLPVSALDRLAEFVAPDDLRFKFRLIPATPERRKRSPSKNA